MARVRRSIDNTDMTPPYTHGIALLQPKKYGWLYHVGAEDFIDLSKDPTHRLIESLNVGGLIVGFELFKFKTANNDYFSKDFYSKYDINELEDKYNSSIDYDQYKDHVYNIEVEDFHTYFVGEAGVWIHH